MRSSQKLRLQVDHYLYDGWPDKDVPLDSSSYRQFHSQVHNQAMASRKPMLVHCSAGIGEFKLSSLVCVA